MFQRIVDLGHREGLDDGSDLVTRAEIEHMINGAGTAHGRSGNCFLPGNQTERGNFHRRENCSDDMQAALGRECSEQPRNVQRRIDGRKNKVQAAGDAFVRPVSFGIVHEMGSESAGFSFLIVARGEGVNFAAPFIGKLQGQVAQAADADDAHPRRGWNLVGQERIEHGDTPAQERPGLDQIERIRDGAHPRPLRPQAIGKTAVAADDGALGGWAKIVIAGQTLVAMKTAGRRPTNANALAQFEAFGLPTQGDHRSDRFMSRNERELRHAPLVVEHGKIGMANSAVRNFDFHLLRAQFAGVKFKGLQESFGASRRVSMNRGHVTS